MLFLVQVSNTKKKSYYICLFVTLKYKIFLYFSNIKINTNMYNNSLNTIINLFYMENYPIKENLNLELYKLYKITKI